MKKAITVFTPTYNRADLLTNGYIALKEQTNKDFLWLIIDDGSTDNTCELVEKWQDEGYVQIQYVRKENGGLHTGYNKAIEIMNTELCICIDSDDTLPANGIELIKSYWSNINDDQCAGIIGLDFLNGDYPIGGFFEGVPPYGHLTDLRYKYGHTGDVKIVCRTDLLKKHWPMPTFKGEKNFNPIYYYLKVDEEYWFVYLNKNLCNVFYQTAGMTANIFNQYYNSPRSFATLRELHMSMNRLPWRVRFKNAIHYVSSCFILKDFKMLFSTQHKMKVLSALPLGLLLYLLILYKKA